MLPLVRRPLDKIVDFRSAALPPLADLNSATVWIALGHKAYHVDNTVTPDSVGVTDIASGEKTIPLMDIRSNVQQLADSELTCTAMLEINNRVGCPDRSAF